MRQLALTLRPEPFETQNSFASRLAARNGCATAYEFCHDMRMSWRALINGDRDHLQRLEGLSGLNRGTLINTAIRSSDPYAVQIGNETFKSWIMRRAELRLCPACYRDGSHSGRTFMACTVTGGDHRYDQDMPPTCGSADRNAGRSFRYRQL